MIYLFLLLYQHSQENGFKGQGVVGLANSSRMQPGSGKERVEVVLVSLAQRAAKVGKRRFFLLDELVGGWQRSTHFVALKRVRVGKRPFLPLPA